MEVGTGDAGGIPTPDTAAFAFVPYEVADLRRFPSRIDLRDERAPILAVLVSAVVEAESPIREDLVLERIRLHYGLQRAGRIVREAVARGIDAALASRQVEWLDTATSQDRWDRFLVMPGVSQGEPRGPSTG